jgi:hypothetical protein
MPDNRDLDQPGRSDDPAMEDDIVGLEEDSDDEFEDLEEEDEPLDEKARGQEFADVVGDEGGSSGEPPS